MEEGERMVGGIANDNIANGLVILAGGVVVGLVGFDQVGLENDGGQIAFDDLKNERFRLAEKMSRFAVGETTTLEMLG